MQLLSCVLPLLATALGELGLLEGGRLQESGVASLSVA